VVRAIARRRGNDFATREIKTAGPAARIELTPDRNTIDADGEDLSFVTVTLVDASGVPVPDADTTIELQLGGDGAIAAVDNGDQISHAPFAADRVRLFNGKALVIVRARLQPGVITLSASAEGLGTTTAQIELNR
jgi:beta-galactosidase